MKLTRQQIVATAAFPVAFVILYFGLALHLRLGIGRWPDHISDNPKTPFFHWHSVITSLVFYLGFLATSVTFPLAGVMALFKRTRHASLLVAAFACACIIAAAMMYLAPGSFVEWWWD